MMFSFKKIRSRYFFFAICLLIFFTAVSQRKNDLVEIKFLPVFENETVIPGKYYPLSQNDSIKIAVLRFYISSLKLIDQNNHCFFDKPTYHLIDIRDTNSFFVQTTASFTHNLEKIEFVLGIDSLTNTNGIGTGDLDPAKGMYWTWQSGYINMKLEANLKSMAGENSSIVFHLGGFLPPFLACQKLIFEFEKNTTSKNNVIVFDIKKYLSAIDLKDQHKVMSPSVKAVDLSKLAAKSFSVK